MFGCYWGEADMPRASRGVGTRPSPVNRRMGRKMLWVSVSSLPTVVVLSHRYVIR
jgi:hypothetical protein